MTITRSFKVVWIDPSGKTRERVFAIDPSRAESSDIKQAGRQMATNSRYGLQSLVWILPCRPDGTCEFQTQCR